MEQRAQRQQEMVEFLRAWQGSGVSLRSFAVGQGIAYSRALYWRRRLVDKPEAKAERIELTEVRVRSKASAGEPFEVHLATGRVVRVPAGFDDKELQRLVGALERC